MQEKIDVAIIGSGLSGLAAGVALAQAGKTVKIFESKSYIGGRVSSEYRDGFILDRGFHLLLTSYPECIKQLNYEQLELKKFKKGFSVFKDGQLFNIYPLDGGFVSSLMLLFSKLIKLQDVIALIRLRHFVKTTSSYEFLYDNHQNGETSLEKKWFSSNLIKTLFKPLMGALLLDNSLQTPSLLVDYMIKKVLVGEMSIPRKGLSVIPEQLALKLAEGSIELNKDVYKITSDNELVFDDGKKIKAKDILIATDPWSAAKFLSIPLPPKGKDVINLHFSAAKSPMKEKEIFLNGESSAVINHLAVLSDISPDYAPKDKSLVSITVLGKYIHLSDESLLEEVTKELKSFFGEDVVSWKLLKIERLLNALPSTYPDRLWHSSNHYKVRDHLYACGDYLEAPTMNSALKTGRLAAQEILKEK